MRSHCSLGAPGRYGVLRRRLVRCRAHASVTLAPTAIAPASVLKRMSMGSKTRLSRKPWMHSSSRPSAAVASTASRGVSRDAAIPARALGERCVDEGAQHAVLDEVRALLQRRQPQEHQQVDGCDAQRDGDLRSARSRPEPLRNDGCPTRIMARRKPKTVAEDGKDLQQTALTAAPRPAFPRGREWSRSPPRRPAPPARDGVPGRKRRASWAGTIGTGRWQRAWRAAPGTSRARVCVLDEAWAIQYRCRAEASAG